MHLLDSDCVAEQRKENELAAREHIPALGAKVMQMYLNMRLHQPHIKMALLAISELLHASENSLHEFQKLVDKVDKAATGILHYEDLRMGLWGILPTETRKVFDGGPHGQMMTDLVLAFDTDWSGTVDRCQNMLVQYPSSLTRFDTDWSIGELTL
jgi:hypothetical protein